MHFYIHPEISWTPWLLQSGLETYLTKALKGHTVIDIPCGPNPQETINYFSHIGVQRYIGVDIHPIDPVSHSTMQIETHAADILAYLSQLPDYNPDNPHALYIAGLQLDHDFAHQTEVIIPYLTELYNELSRVCHLLIVNDPKLLISGLDDGNAQTVDPSTALHRRGFALRRTCPHGKVHVFESFNQTTLIQ